MTRQPQPFRFTLKPDEIVEIAGAEVVGSGGLQTMLREVQSQLERGNVVEFDDEGLGKLIRYMTRYDPNGGFELRLRNAFLRSIYDLFSIKVTF